MIPRVHTEPALELDGESYQQAANQTVSEITAVLMVERTRNDVWKKAYKELADKYNELAEMVDSLTETSDAD